MKPFFIIVFLFIIATGTCAQERPARQLNDSAIAVNQGDSGSVSEYEKAISLLDRATAIDSNYYLAYGRSAF